MISINPLMLLTPPYKIHPTIMPKSLLIVIKFKKLLTTVRYTWLLNLFIVCSPPCFIGGRYTWHWNNNGRRIHSKKLDRGLANRKKQVERRFKGVHLYLERVDSIHHVLLEKELQNDYNHILFQEEIHWYQKSREQ
ncbi:hypothetical protein MTR_8g028370 [Medicago truncatula]|uniref:Uncharacterized protein n=1 Tax=Medicago truncatula TaxID=3880 RepID=A0A072TYZ5_MEDTR|nr:hypothetical protein MTR_8g028370 [Medicago truncatula]